MRPEDEGIDEGPSAADVLAVADGLRRRDPQLSAALAEHAVRLSPDGGRRRDAELSAVLAHRELDRPVEVVARGVALLRETERAGRHAPAAALRCALAECALSWSDTGLAEALLDPLMAGDGLPEDARLALAGARAQLCAALGDVAGADTAAADVERLRAVREDVVLARHDVRRARARARRVGGDLRGARDLLDAAPAVGDGADGGRRAVLLALDRVETALDLGDTTAARETASSVLDRPVAVTTALPAARVRCVLAARVHLPAGEVDTAATLVQAVVDDLSARGQDHQMAIAQELLSHIAEARRDPAAALVAQRRAHRLERRALLAAGHARVELAGVAYGAPADDGARHAAPHAAAGAAGGNGHRPDDDVRGRWEPESGRARALDHDQDRGEGARAERAEPTERADHPCRSGGVRADPWLAPREDGVAVDGLVAAGDTGPPGHGRNGDRPDDRVSAPTADVAPARGTRQRENGADARDERDALGARDGRDDRDARDDRDDRDARRTEDRRFGDVDLSGHETDAGGPDPAPDDEYARELAVTLEGLLAEYRDHPFDAEHAGDPADRGPDRDRDSDRGSDRDGGPDSGPDGDASAVASWGDGGVRRPWPLAAWSFHDEAAASGQESTPLGELPPGTRDAAPPRPDPLEDSGARLADLLAEAMDAFRRTAPGETDTSPPPTDRRGARR